MMPQHIFTLDHFLPESLCDRLIQQFEKDSRVQEDPQPEYSDRHYIYTSDKPEWASLNQEITSFADQITSEYFERPGVLRSTAPMDWFDDGYVMARYSKGHSCGLHDDGQNPEPGRNNLRYATLLFYLNDVPEGGETVFPMQEVEVSPRKGRAVMFPAMFTHPHFVAETQSTRYIYQTWIVDPELRVVYDAE